MVSILKSHSPSVVDSGRQTSAAICAHAPSLLAKSKNIAVNQQFSLRASVEFARLPIGVIGAIDHTEPAPAPHGRNSNGEGNHLLRN